MWLPGWGISDRPKEALYLGITCPKPELKIGSQVAGKAHVTTRR